MFKEERIDDYSVHGLICAVGESLSVCVCAWMHVCVCVGGCSKLKCLQLKQTFLLFLFLIFAVDGPAKSLWRI